MPLETFLWLNSTQWTGIYTLLTLLLVATAVVTARYAKGQWEQAKAAQAEAIRPYVIALTEAHDDDWQNFDLVFWNLGSRPAYDLTVAFDPLPARSDDDPRYLMANMDLFHRPVPMLAPGERLRTFWDNHADRHKEPGLPWSHRVTLTYRDSSKSQYTETTTIDLASMCGAKKRTSTR